ncbi:MAG: DNA-3-methyladenine glycosylase 2 family protein [Dethiobacter sp.]|jgi:DNA-3-methyladenine glycosylase II|nr:DNA-3-methyladenine glycosylase 2 family protein [Dethiobacter sp.]
MPTELIFRTTDPAVKRISEADPAMAKLISFVGDYTLAMRTDYFASLVRAIIGQQISVKAARTIWERMIAICEEVKPDKILNIHDDELRKAGLSRAKIAYIKDLCEKVISKEVDFLNIDQLDNAAILESLTGVRGVGNWTAEMFLIFSLGRLNVLAVADAGLRSAVKWLYRLDSLPTKEEMLAQGKAWEPYETIASLYLWEAVNRRLVDLDNWQDE